jgi:ankyrin repeat protein
MNSERAHFFIDACYESLGKASELIEKDNSILHDKTMSGETALFYYAVEDKLNIVKFLYEKGSSINTKDNGGSTPLSVAASLGHYEMAKYLLANGARCHGEFLLGDPILFEALSSGKPEIIELLISQGADLYERNALGETLLHESAGDDDFIDVTMYIVSKGFDINSIGSFERTPLHQAIFHGAQKSAKYLITNGADTTIKDSKGRMPIDLAFESSNNVLIELLKNY